MKPPLRVISLGLDLVTSRESNLDAPQQTYNNDERTRGNLARRAKPSVDMLIKGSFPTDINQAAADARSRKTKTPVRSSRAIRHEPTWLRSALGTAAAGKTWFPRMFPRGVFGVELARDGFDGGVG